MDDIKTIYYNHKGEEFEKPINENFEYKILAKKRGNRYWIAFSAGKPVEMRKINLNELKNALPKLENVTESVFDKYIAYLQCKNQRISVSNIKE